MCVHPLFLASASNSSSKGLSVGSPAGAGNPPDVAATVRPPIEHRFHAQRIPDECREGARVATEAKTRSTDAVCNRERLTGPDAARLDVA